MRQITLTLEPEGAFAVPTWNGYQVYGALLSALGDVSAGVSERLHDAPLGSLHNSGLVGSFANSERKHHKQTITDQTYTLDLGVTDPRDQDVFEALADAFVFSGDSLDLDRGSFHVRSFASMNATHEELLADAAELVEQAPPNVELELTFRTPTCIRETAEITTMFPHRASTFRSLLRRWNKTVPTEQADELELSLARADFEENLIEKPDFRSLDSHSVLVNRGENGRPIQRQGFSGQCTYKFKGASEAVRTAVTALALFGEFGGVGGFVARGCGAVAVEVNS
ncbi:CRISPR system precrRNA processing endoribonuclease RAMP protein Cas6 [Halocatena pleomorpha]|uniref:CRISPR system precrRNA processing endoribonuclease RAMP protein Cas6 n=1 Tax=Halocatena pleomorpha TaxID=1785090 RepID=A0A3P3R564_9EURY|nr:CRISPR system precrRNA processing endoribonuclease RAMP protein Cas6 [Halocatena pleomorpha]RRJ28494.1 CRISPR system precrRNA processing endoribonuclease RAMP protein Cas6 [Halocatena pleomorpha]